MRCYPLSTTASLQPPVGLAIAETTRLTKPYIPFVQGSAEGPFRSRVPGFLSIVGLPSIVGLLAVVLGSGCGGAAEAGSDAGSDAAEMLLPVSVRPAMVAEGFKVVREYQGQIEARRRSKVGFDLSGVLVRVAVDEGAEVAKGATVAWLDTQRLVVRKRQLAAAVKEAETALALANSTLARFATALERKAVSPQDMDEATRGRDLAAAALERTVAQFEGVLVDFSKSRLQAPYRAYVSDRLADEGEVVAPGQPILELIEIDRPRVRVGVSLEVASRGEIGDQETLTVAGRTLQARRLAALPEQSSQTRTVDLLFELEEPLGALRVGQMARLRLQSRVTGDAGISLPTSALTEASRGLWSCLVAVRGNGAGGAEGDREDGADENGNRTDPSVYTLERRVVEIVEVGSVDGAPRVTVRGGLQPGELVVMEGLHRLVPGQRVRLAHDAASSGGSDPDRTLALTGSAPEVAIR